MSPVLLVALAGCSVGPIGGPEQDSERAPLPDSTAEAFAEFSGIRLPADSDEFEVTVERNDRGDPRYLIRLTGIAEDGDTVCNQVGNYEPFDDGIAEQMGPLRIRQADLDGIQEPILGCSAVIQSTDVEVMGVALSYEDGSTRLFLSAEPSTSRL